MINKLDKLEALTIKRIEYIEKTNNIINMIYEEDKVLCINIENYDYYKAGEKK